MIAWVHPSKLFAALILVSAALLSWSQLAQAQVHQQGPKLVGTGAAGHFPVQVQSVALSTDGNPPSWEGLSATTERRGSGPGAAVSGPSRAPSWLAAARLEPAKAIPSRCRPTATPPSSGGAGDNSGTGAGSFDRAASTEGNAGSSTLP
jgi:hypothetical protein